MRQFALWSASSILPAMKRIISFTFICLLAASVGAEDRKFSLDDLSILPGHWRASEAMGGPEELWLPVRAGVMTGFFRWPSVQGHYVLEVLTAMEVDGKVIFRFKHFDPDITPWEKEEANTYELTGAADGCVVLTGIDTSDKVPAVMLYCRVGSDSLVFRGADKITLIAETDFVIEFSRYSEKSD